MRYHERMGSEHLTLEGLSMTVRCDQTGERIEEWVDVRRVRVETVSRYWPATDNSPPDQEVIDVEPAADLIHQLRLAARGELPINRTTPEIEFREILPGEDGDGLTYTIEDSDEDLERQIRAACLERVECL
jgi:hypothetical protein